jgi:hypothetical protein
MTAHPNNLPARRPRHDGWTAERQEAFLKVLANCGCVTHAAAAVGMSRQSAHNLYNRPSAHAFRRAYDAALDCSLRLVEDGMWSRAIHGVPRPIFFQGEQVGEYRHYDERLTMFLLRTRRPHRYAMQVKLVPPAPPPGCEDNGPDPDEAIGTLDWNLGDLVDETDLPAAEAEGATIDGVNFANFQATERSDADADASPEQREEMARIGRPPAERPSGSTSRDSLA